jgi:hypothetical protein
VKLPLFVIALPRYEAELRRCCDDVPKAREDAQPVWPLRWTRKLAMAVPTTFRVFRRQMATPLAATIEPGTRVISSKGRSLGVVRSLVVEMGTGGAAYAIEQGTGDARVMLLPRQTLHEDADVAVVDERVVRRLERLSA